MHITPEIKAILQELINTGMGRAAAAFSEMLAVEIDIRIPDLEVLDYEGMLQLLEKRDQQNCVNVVQRFKGGLNGKGLVSFPVLEGKTLIQQLLEMPQAQKNEFDFTEKEVIAEVGNLIINAIGCSISDMAHVEIDCDLPEVFFEDHLIELRSEPKDHLYCIGQAIFRAHGLQVEGTIFFIYSYENMESLLPGVAASPHGLIKILIVDDSLLSRQMLKRHLQGLKLENLDVREATTGKQALEKMSEEPPDLLIVDLLMPEMNGEELLEILHEKQMDCFKVVVSSNFQKPVQERVTQLGAEVFMEKPITPEKLSFIMKRFLHGTKRHETE